MSSEVLILSGTAALLGLVHTLLGPDHYLPFVVMGRARGWSMLKTAWITIVCGFGHVLSSVVLGLIGIACGIAVLKLEALEAFRGNLAAWALISFGVAYAGWGVHRGIRNAPHRHLQSEKTSAPVHSHAHSRESKSKTSLTPWVLFIIFVMGPCEPLIPLLMYPAAKESVHGAVWVAIVFGLVTVGTMLAVVLATARGIRMIRFGNWERWIHALAGGAIGLSGLAIQFLGL